MLKPVYKLVLERSFMEKSEISLQIDIFTLNKFDQKLILEQIVKIERRINQTIWKIIRFIRIKYYKLVRIDK